MRPHGLPRDGEGGGGSWGEERPLGEPPTLGGNSRPAEVPVDSGSFVAIVMGLEVRLQWALVKCLLLKRRVWGGPTPQGRSPDSCPRCQRVSVGTSHMALCRTALSSVVCERRQRGHLALARVPPGISPPAFPLPCPSGPWAFACAVPHPEPSPQARALLPPHPPFPAAFTYSSGELSIARGSGHVYRPSPQQHRWSAPWSVVPSVPTAVPAHRALSTWEWMRAVPQDISHRTAACAC